MTEIATNNGVPIVSNGQLATSCGCCFPDCVPAGCSDIPSQLVFTVSAPEESGQPWADTSGTFPDPVFGNITKRETITFPAMSETIVVDLKELESHGNFFTQISGEFLTVILPTTQAVEAGFCQIIARATQSSFTLQGEAGQDAYTGYAYERRDADAQVFMESGLSPGISVSVEKGWEGMGYAFGGGGNRPLERFETTYSAPAVPAACKTFPSSFLSSTVNTASRGGFYEDLIGNNGSVFCLVPGWDGTTAAPQVGEEYGYMVGFIRDCNRKWFGRQIRVASSSVDLSIGFQ